MGRSTQSAIMPALRLFAHGFFTMLERSNDVVQQRNGNFFMMKTVAEDGYYFAVAFFLGDYKEANSQGSYVSC